METMLNFMDFRVSYTKGGFVLYFFVSPHFSRRWFHTDVCCVDFFVPLDTCQLFFFGWQMYHSSILTTAHLKPIILTSGSRHAVAVLIAAGFCRFKARGKGLFPWSGGCSHGVLVVPMEWW